MTQPCTPRDRPQVGPDQRSCWVTSTPRTVPRCSFACGLSSPVIASPSGSPMPQSRTSRSPESSPTRTGTFPPERCTEVLPTIGRPSTSSPVAASTTRQRADTSRRGRIYDVPVGHRRQPPSGRDRPTTSLVTESSGQVARARTASRAATRYQQRTDQIADTPPVTRVGKRGGRPVRRHKSEFEAFRRRVDRSTERGVSCRDVRLAEFPASCLSAAASVRRAKPRRLRPSLWPPSPFRRRA